MHGLTSIVSSLREARVLLVGDLVLDTYLYGCCDRVSREAPVVIVRETRRESMLGGAGNVAAGLRALGAEVEVVGVVGDDSAGDALRSLLSSLGINGKGLVRVEGRATECKTRILAGGLSTTPQQVLRLDQGETSPVGAAAQKAVRGRIASAARKADVVAVSDYGSGLLTPALRRHVVRLTKKKPVLVDARYDLLGYVGATLVKPNLPELEAALGQRFETTSEVARGARRLRSKLGARAVLVTRGHQGLTLQGEHGSALHLPVHGLPAAVDVTGAGDTVMATLAASVAAGASLADATRLANVAAGLVVQKPGTATVSADELAVALSSEARQ